MFNRSRKHRPRGIHFEIIPMIDVMMILVLFLAVMAFLPQVQSAIQSDLPESGSEEDVTKDDILINIEDAGSGFPSFRLNDEPVAESEIVDKIKSLMKDDSAKKRVVIAAEKTIAYDHVVRILAKLQEADLRNVALATERRQD